MRIACVPFIFAHTLARSTLCVYRCCDGVRAFACASISSCAVTSSFWTHASVVCAMSRAYHLYALSAAHAALSDISLPAFGRARTRIFGVFAFYFTRARACARSSSGSPHVCILRRRRRHRVLRAQALLAAAFLRRKLCGGRRRGDIVITCCARGMHAWYLVHPSSFDIVASSACNQRARIFRILSCIIIFATASLLRLEEQKRCYIFGAVVIHCVYVVRYHPSVFGEEGKRRRRATRAPEDVCVAHVVRSFLPFAKRRALLLVAPA